ncbi:MAG: hypothetical protein IPG82_00910 [Saprospiraceae bacterium]|nr:hypothetical protein [Saprospiraceae bacterium]
MNLALIIFTYFSGIGFIFIIVWSFKIETAYKMLSQAAGINLGQIAESSPEPSKAMKFLLMDFTSQMLGMNLFALLIIWIPFRNGELWAWMVLWFYPIMFAWHYLHYAKGTKFSLVQLVYCALSSLTLILSFKHFH